MIWIGRDRPMWDVDFKEFIGFGLWIQLNCGLLSFDHGFKSVVGPTILLNWSQFSRVYVLWETISPNFQLMPTIPAHESNIIVCFWPQYF